MQLRSAPPAENKRSRLNDFERQLPILNSNNFMQWHESLKNLAYYAEWDNSILDMEGTMDPWDGKEEEDKTIRQGRRDAYAVVRLCISPELQHIISNMRPGDARGMFKKLFNRFCRLTSGAIQSLKNEVNAMTMESTGNNVEVYASTLETKFRLLLKVSKREANEETASELCRLLIDGLLSPEFTAISVYLKMQPSSQLKFETTVEAIINFAVDHQVDKLCRGGSSRSTTLAAAAKEPPRTPNKKQICRDFAKKGKCRWGTRCHFEHTDSGQQATPAEDHPWRGGPCHRCGEKDHPIAKCPQPPDEEKKGDNTDKTAKQFMMKVVTATTMTLRKNELNQREKNSMIIFDGGSTDHICPWIDAYLHDTLTDCHVEIDVGNGHTMTASQKGSILIQPTDPDASPIILINTLLCPDCPYFVLSERKFDDAQCRISKYSGKVEIETIPDGELIITGKMKAKDNLYHANCKIVYHEEETSANKTRETHQEKVYGSNFMQAAGPSTSTEAKHHQATGRTSADAELRQTPTNNLPANSTKNTPVHGCVRNNCSGIPTGVGKLLQNQVPTTKINPPKLSVACAEVPGPCPRTDRLETTVVSATTTPRTYLAWTPKPQHNQASLRSSPLQGQPTVRLLSAVEQQDQGKDQEEEEVQDRLRSQTST